jgi:hypothetical protein
VARSVVAKASCVARVYAPQAPPSADAAGPVFDALSTAHVVAASVVRSRSYVYSTPTDNRHIVADRTHKGA